MQWDYHRHSGTTVCSLFPLRLSWLWHHIRLYGRQCSSWIILYDQVVPAIHMRTHFIIDMTLLSLMSRNANSWATYVAQWCIYFLSRCHPRNILCPALVSNLLLSVDCSRKSLEMPRTGIISSWKWHTRLIKLCNDQPIFVAPRLGYQ